MLDWFLVSDPRLVLLSFAYIITVIVVSEALRRGLRLPPDVSRKIVHVSVAAWALPTAILFRSPWWAAACPLTFVALNALSYRFRLMDLIEEEGKGNPGTIYFPLSFAAVILILWPLDGRAASVAGLYAMGFGDAAASVIGRRWGRHRYRVGTDTKSWEGTAAMFGFSFTAILLAVHVLTSAWSPLPALVAALVATAAEAPARRGTDNLTVPLSGALAYWLVARGLG